MTMKMTRVEVDTDAGIDAYADVDSVYCVLILIWRRRGDALPLVF